MTNSGPYNVHKGELAELLKSKLSHHFGVKPSGASDEYFYKACVLVVKDLLTKQRERFRHEGDAASKKQVNYLCMEFLMGRSLKNNLYNMGLTEVFGQALEQYGVQLDRLYEHEPDAGLGNGGLGRLAACFLDGLATGGYPATGYSILYEFGIFRQKLVDGWQTELPDFWLPGGEVWLQPKPDQAFEIRFGGSIQERWDGDYHVVCHENYTPVRAVPYDMMVAGYGGGVSKLRLWKAEASSIDMKLFNEGDYLRAMEQNAMAEVISKVLYPADNHPEGKSLRLRQQYFLVSASVQDIVRRHLNTQGTMDNLYEQMAIHINDTHPALVIPELMRLLLDECGYSWDAAWRIVSRTVAYTNHTVMSEALESWQEEPFRQMLPRIYQIVREIDNRLRAQVWERTGDAAYVERTAIIAGGTVRMANLCVACSYSVNGVSRLHSEILKNSVFHDYFRLTPEKFRNVTNGIAHRRWLCQANPKLAELIEGLIGDGFIRDAGELSRLQEFADRGDVLNAIGEIKQYNKRRLADYILKNNGIKVDPESIFDVQAKRLHEYKRQHLNALHILSEYFALKENPGIEFHPKTYLFAAKAAPGYFMAKKIIQLICAISRLLESDPQVRDRLRVVYLEDYRVTVAETLLPAADLSEQISLAGTEASGTGNMKLMMNGAVTLGTMDGANVEIHEAVGQENILIFGLKDEEAAQLRHGYDPRHYYFENPKIRQVLDFIITGMEGGAYAEIGNQLMLHDPYLVLADFQDYSSTHRRAMKLYEDKALWNRMSLQNIAASGRFAADRAIEDYARNIWGLK